jgi:hypothetical protein
MRDDLSEGPRSSLFGLGRRGISPTDAGLREVAASRSGKALRPAIRE